MLCRTNDARTERRREEGRKGATDGGGITYWAEKAKKRMTALSVARSNAEKDGRTAAMPAGPREDTRCEAYDVVKTSTFFHRWMEGRKGEWRVPRPVRKCGAWVVLISVWFVSLHQRHSSAWNWKLSISASRLPKIFSNENGR